MTLTSTAETFVGSSAVSNTENRPGYRPRHRIGRILASTLALATSCPFSVQADSTIPSDTAVELVKHLGSGQHLNADRADLIVIARIRELGTYPSGWNRPDSVAPARAAVDDAERFARSLNLASLPLPHISAADDGEINFWWERDGLYVDLGFFGDGSYSFYARLPNGKEMTEDEAPVSRPLPSELLSFLEKSA